MASNLPIAGYGRSLPTGGVGGPGIPTGSASLIQNPSYEIPGTNIGEAVNWVVSVVSSASEYATFDHPGSNIITDQIPAEQPILGYSIAHQLDGTFVISQATNANNAEEDFEQGWTGNDNFAFAFSDAANDPSNFDGKSIDDFESGWGNDSGALSDIDALDHATAVFNAQPVEHFDAGWPAASNGILISNIPNIVFGIWDNTNNVFTHLDEITGVGQYADTLILRVTSDEAPPGSITIHLIDKDGNLATVVAEVTHTLHAGDILLVPGAENFGVRNIDHVTEVGGATGTFALEGDPGLLRDAHDNIIAQWERAVFG